VRLQARILLSVDSRFRGLDAGKASLTSNTDEEKAAEDGTMEAFGSRDFLFPTSSGTTE
jgi:hypothetical protein